MTTKILKCFCESEFQDKEYGHFMRLSILTSKDGVWRCSVCGKEQSSGTKATKKPKTTETKKGE